MPLPLVEVSTTGEGAEVSTERRGWCLKKGKTDQPWAKAHHSHRYFVSRGNALCYFERAADESSELGGHRLLGLIDLRDVLRVRPSADATAPAHALDLVLRARTYVLVPQPATADESAAWVRVWARSLRMNAIAPELRIEAGLRAESSWRASISAGSAPAGTSEGDGGAGAGAPSFGWPMPMPDVLMQGYLLKMPVRNEHRRGLRAMALLGELVAWKRRYFQLRCAARRLPPAACRPSRYLPPADADGPRGFVAPLRRPGMLQWYRDDPSAGGEFLGVLQLTADATIELSSDLTRLQVSAAGETLMLRNDTGEQLATWEAEIGSQIRQLRLGGS